MSFERIIGWETIPRVRAVGVLLITAAILAAAGTALNRFVAPVWAHVRTKEPALRRDAIAASAGQGVTLALLGGFRTLVADAAWLRMYALWERRDLAGTAAAIRFVSEVDPRPVVFWLNGARIIACDLPVWRVDAAAARGFVSDVVRDGIHREHARLALEHLEAAMTFHPHNADLWIERANIELTILRDGPAAAESYRRAWELPDAPFYVARLRGELLRRLGRKREALAWLVSVHPRQPANEIADGDVVLARIRELERDLGIAPRDAYHPAQ